MKVDYLPPKYTQQILPPIIIDSNQQSIFEAQSKTSIILSNQNQNSIISEYKATSSPKNSQEIKISPYISSSQPNHSTSIHIQPIITKPIDSSLNNMNQSTISNSSIIESLGESHISHPMDTQQPLSQSVITQNPINQSNKVQNSSVLSILNIYPSPKNIKSNKSLMGNIPGALPVYRLIQQGAGINPTEEQGIVFCAMKIYQEEVFPLSNYTAKYIQRKIGGDWIVIVYEYGKPVDFNMTCVAGNDYMYFLLDNIAYQVCRLR